jgi:hypothetical protein
MSLYESNNHANENGNKSQHLRKLIELDMWNLRNGVTTPV